jgi:hypothetical protein
MRHSTRKTMLGKVEIVLSTPVKKSKRRESSMDQDSSTRAERLKAKENLDVQVRSSVNHSKIM